MIRTVFLGFGNVGSRLCSAILRSNEVTVIQIFNKSAKSLSSEFEAIPFTTNLSEIQDADVYIIAIPDDAIATFSESLPFENKLVVHSSGAVAMSVLSEKNRKGIFYPLQTFSKNRQVDFKEIPICIEAENASDVALLKKLGNVLSEKVVEITSEERAKLHVAAVFVNNFVNHMYHIGENYLSENNISFDLLKPLIAETSAKIESLSPSEVQTGPAKRNDKKTIEKHLHLLEGSPFQKLYQQLSNSISNEFKK